MLPGSVRVDLGMRGEEVMSATEKVMMCPRCDSDVTHVQWFVYSADYAKRYNAWKCTKCEIIHLQSAILIADPRP